MIVLGLHGGVTVNQHEPSAALAVNGRIVALCEEERYLRVKSCYGLLPLYSIKACLKAAGIRIEDVDLVVTPGITYGDFEARIADYLRHNFGHVPRIECVHHQMAHLAAAFYGSGVEEAICVSLDASGDGACGMIGHGTRAGGIKLVDEIPTANSLGYFYTLMTHYLGFTDGDEYKLMGLAPYGKASIDLNAVVRPSNQGWTFDQSFVRNNPPVRSPFEPLYSPRLPELLGQPNRRPGGEMTDFHRDLAQSTQAQFEACFTSFIDYARKRVPNVDNLCYAGGIALNCAANRAVFYSDRFRHFYVSPVSSDRGLSAGCAYLGAVMLGDTPWQLHTPYLGTSYSNDSIRQELEANGCDFQEVDDPAEAGAALLAHSKILGWFQGRSEAGARALGNRSILAPAGDAKVRDMVNARIKYREEFRPFAPSALHEDAGTYFKTNGADFPSMSITVDAQPGMAERLRAVVHVDDTARLQTVRSTDNEVYYNLIKAYRNKTGTGVVLNTSFNLKGQPIVESPRDALMTFYGCGLDALILGNFVVTK
jgi:carbamoyltransferase